MKAGEMDSVLLKLLRGLRANMTARTRRERRPRKSGRESVGWAMHTVFHPFDGFEGIKYGRMGSPVLGVCICLLLLAVDTIAYSEQGFLFNLNRPEDFNLAIQFLQSDLLVVLWCVTSWCMSTLMDGEGRIGEIWCVTTISMLPKVILTLPLVALSNVLAAEEEFFLQFGTVCMWVWIAALLFIGMMTLHQYTLGKTVWLCVLSVLCIVCIAFLTLLFVSIFQQLVTFVQTIFRESMNLGG